MKKLKYKKGFGGKVIYLSWFLIVWLSAACYGQPNSSSPTADVRLMGATSQTEDVAAGKTLAQESEKATSKWRASDGSGKTYNSDSVAGGSSSLLPVPQQVSLGGNEFTIDKNWSIQLGKNVSKEGSAAKSLRTGLKHRYGLYLKGNNPRNNAKPNIMLKMHPGVVTIEEVVDTNRAALQEQAYKITLAQDNIRIDANAPAGLYYGVQTLLQMINQSGDTLMLTEGEITDWPDLELRMIYWDDNHHLERMEAFKDAIRKASFYKINAFALKLNGHFQFKSAKPLVEPYALSPQQYQELTDFAKERHVQLVPYIDAPAHVAFILKHPEYADLRAFPNSNYEFCVTNPETYKLLIGMFTELFEANRGGDYVLLSTDEPYYVGMADNYQCREKKEAEELGGRGALLAKFIRKLSNDLHKQGRKVIFWGEYPLRPTDVEKLPQHLIKGGYTDELRYDPIYPESYKTSYYDNHDTEDTDVWGKNGIREIIYKGASEIGEEPEKGVAGTYKTITSVIERGNADIMGTVIAGWGDGGPHPETYWPGYAAGSAIGWNYQDSSDPENLMMRFLRSYYGPGAYKMDKIYELMSTQGQFYRNSWDEKPSDNRGPIFGNHKEIYESPHPAMDQTIPMLPVPSAQDLTLSSNWSEKNTSRLESAQSHLKTNNELIKLLNKNFRNVQYNRYSIKVMLSLAYQYRQNLHMLIKLGEANTLLEKASAAASSSNPSVALTLVDQALEKAQTIKEQRNTVFQFMTSVWYQTWFPRVKKANDREYLDRVDDVKDHLPMRTVDMSYLIYRELNYPLGKWVEQVQKNRNQFAQNHQMREKTINLQWLEYK